MHDSTNIPLSQPVDAALQRALKSWSGCYGLPLNTRHSDDTCFIEDTAILQKQKLFAESNKSNTKPFHDVFDKGYQCVLTAMVQGQYCPQPAFAESDTQFKANMAIHSGPVAVVCSGNERAVNRCKMSWFLKRGNANLLLLLSSC